LLDQLFPSVDSHRYLMGLALESVEGGWAGFLRTTLLDILMGPLRAMGFVDVSPSPDDVRAIQLRGFQDVQWGKAAVVPLKATGELNREAVRLIVGDVARRPDDRANAPMDPGQAMVVEVQSPVPPAFMTFVLRWARPAGFSKNVVRYDLDVGRLHQAFEEGNDPEVLTEAWHSAVGFAPLPEILDWWRFWWDRYGHVRLYPPQALIQTRDAFTLQEVQAALPELQSLIVGIVAPEAALLEPDDVDKVLNALTRQGYMPKEFS
jgi:hypothetical protein